MELILFAEGAPRVTVAIDHIQPSMKGAERVATTMVPGMVINQRLTKWRTTLITYSAHFPLPYTPWECLRLTTSKTSWSTQYHAATTTLVSCCMHLKRGGDLGYHCRGSEQERKAQVEAATEWLPPAGTPVIWGTSGLSGCTPPHIDNIKPIPRPELVPNENNFLSFYVLT